MGEHTIKRFLSRAHLFLRCSVLTGVYEPALLATWSNHPKKMAEMDDLITSYSEIHCLRDSHHALDSELPDPALALRYALVHQQHEVMPSILAVLNRCAGYQCAPIPGDVHEGKYVPERKSDPDERRARWDVLSLESYATIREHRKVMRRKVAHMCEQLSYASSRGPPIGSTASPPAALLLEFLPTSYCCSAARVTLLSALELARFLATADLLQAWFTLFKRMRSLAESPPPSVCEACRRRLLSGSDVAERHYTAVWQGFISLGHELDRIMHPALIHVRQLVPSLLICEYGLTMTCTAQNTAFASTSHTAT
jgi:hypothetical protein